jgi:hypothetical protein
MGATNKLAIFALENLDEFSVAERLTKSLIPHKALSSESKSN